ncbi:MAG: hypothetical protein JHC31_06415 [Sulfurihydrogenibium sp.]|jgi:hypothetical protein|nr:hypothetical protein [Sulfurihydrogenibium sp.]
MPYVLTPFNPDSRYQGQVKTELNLANTNFSILGQAFMNNDPATQPILRAVYISNSAPSSPVADMLWYDTSSNLLKVYDGKNWIVINDLTNVNNSITSLSSQIDTIKSAFINKDPSQPILRAVYIGSSAPSNPVADMLWYDTSSNLLKLYDGSNWQAINDVSSLKSQINTLNSAFFSNDPTKTILRATYIGNTAPSNPVAGTTWLDTSQSTPTLKVYDGSNWQAISGGSSSSSNATTLDGYSASQTPTKNTIPVSKDDGKLDPKWLNIYAVIPYWRVSIDETSGSRSDPTSFTVSRQFKYISNGTILWYMKGWGTWSTLWEMKINCSSATSVSGKVGYIDDNVYIYLNGTQIASYTNTGFKNQSFTLNLSQGNNLIQIVHNSSGGGEVALDIEIDFDFNSMTFIPL